MIARLARALAEQLSARQIAFTWRRLRLARRGVRLASWRVWAEAGAVVRLVGRGSVRLGDRVYLRRGTDIEAHDAAVVVGDRFFMNKGSSIVARCGVTVGRDCMIGEGVSICDHNHGHQAGGVPFREQGYACAPVRIGDNVWVGSHAFIGPGVSIGDHVVIGANAVITRDVPAGSVAVTRQTLEIRPLGAGGGASVAERA